MTIDHTLTSLAISALLAAAAVLIALSAGAYLTVCRAIEAHRRIRSRHNNNQHTDKQTSPEQTGHDPETTQIRAWLHAVTELDRACCERWWTTLNTDHDPTCPKQTPKDTR